MTQQYWGIARLVYDPGSIEQYRRILDNDRPKTGETHWNSVGKNTITLFQVLIDRDLRDLVLVLQHYPHYIEVVCEHFRYAYSYSENDADIAAASALLRMGTPYFTRQFVRNVVRKLPKIEKMSAGQMKEMVERLVEAFDDLHPVILHHYAHEIRQQCRTIGLHPLQRIALEKALHRIHVENVYEYKAEDRDAALDIPYMN